MFRSWLERIPSSRLRAISAWCVFVCVCMYACVRFYSCSCVRCVYLHVFCVCVSLYGGADASSRTFCSHQSCSVCVCVCKFVRVCVCACVLRVCESIWGEGGRVDPI